MNASGRRVIITGGGGGAGRTVTQRWLERAASVMIVDRHQESLEEAHAKLGMPAGLHLFAADLTTESGAQSMAGAASRAFGGPPDTLIHLVGGFAMGAIDAPDAHQIWDKMLALNATTAFHCYRAVLPGFRELGYGWIVGLSARIALQPPAKLAAYAASKAALVALTQSVAVETIGENINANIILASTIDTPANRAAMGDKQAGRWVTPDDIAEATFYLCSNAAKAVSGATLEVYARA